MSWADRMRRMGESASNTDRDSVDNNRPDGAAVMQQLPPIAEHPPYPVNPYRGQERHGVPTEASAAQRVAELDQVPESYEQPPFRPPHADIEPIPVITVNKSTDEFRAFRTSQTTVTSTQAPVQVLGRDRMRRKVQVKVMPGGDPLLILSTPSSSPASAYQVNAGENLSMETTEPIYAMIGAGLTGAFLQLYTEYMVNPLDQNANYYHTDDHGPGRPAVRNHDFRG